AVTGKGALALVERQGALLKQLCDIAKANPDSVLERVRQLISSNRVLEKEVEHLKVKLAGAGGGDADNVLRSKACSLLGRKVEGLNAKTLRESVDQLKNRLGTSVVLLANVEGDKASIVAGVTKDLVDRIKAGDLVNMVASQMGGKGGGRPDMAMAGASDIS